MESRRISTDAGPLDLIPATGDQLRGIARYWPMGLVDFPDDPGCLGLVFQQGEQEVHGVKMQPPDIPESDARMMHHANRALIASALPYYLEKQHHGVMVPCAYYKEKRAGMVETGIVFFAGPDAASRSISRERIDVMYDDRLGEGATPMIQDMMGAIARASEECRLPSMTIIGVDLRPRLAMGGLAIHFVLEGPRVFVAKDQLNEDEPVWKYLVRAGFTKLPYAPMKPAAVSGPPLTGTPWA